MTDNLFADQNEEDKVDYLAELVGDGKKFRSVEDLAKGKAESDRFIAKLTSELEEARTEVQKRIALEELKTAILERDNGNNRNPDPLANDKAVNADSIEELINKSIANKDVERTKAANEAAVTEALNNLWGDNARGELEKVAKEVGYTVAQLGEMGRENPKALFRLLGVGNQPAANGGSVPRSSIHIDGSVNSERNKAYYDKLKVSDPRLYNSKRTQVQMYKDAMNLKERFYN